MKNIDVNEIIALVGGGAITGATIAMQISDSNTSQLIGAVLGFLYMGGMCYHEYKKNKESKRK